MGTVTQIPVNYEMQKWVCEECFHVISDVEFHSLKTDKCPECDIELLSAFTKVPTSRCRRIISASVGLPGAYLTGENFDKIEKWILEKVSAELPIWVGVDMAKGDGVNDRKLTRLPDLDD